jgi:hypothetical protein
MLSTWLLRYSISRERLGLKEVLLPLQMLGPSCDMDRTKVPKSRRGLAPPFSQCTSQKICPSSRSDVSEAVAVCTCRKWACRSVSNQAPDSRRGTRSRLGSQFGHFSIDGLGWTGMENLGHFCEHNRALLRIDHVFVLSQPGSGSPYV